MRWSSVFAGLFLACGLAAQVPDPLAPVDDAKLRSVESRIADLREALVQHALGLHVDPKFFQPREGSSEEEVSTSRLAELRDQIRARRALLRSADAVRDPSAENTSVPTAPVEYDQLTTAQLVQQAVEEARAAAEAGSEQPNGAAGAEGGADAGTESTAVEQPDPLTVGQPDWPEDLFDGTRVTSRSFPMPRDALQTLVVAALRLDRAAHRAAEAEQRALLQARRDRLCALVIKTAEGADTPLRPSEIYAQARAHEISGQLDEAAGLFMDLLPVALNPDEELQERPDGDMFRELARAGLNRLRRTRERASTTEKKFSWPRIEGAPK